MRTKKRRITKHSANLSQNRLDRYSGLTVGFSENHDQFYYIAAALYLGRTSRLVGSESLHVIDGGHSHISDLLVGTQDK